MKNYIHSVDALHTFNDYDMRYTVQVIYVRWSGGGEGYEFRISDGGQVLYTSADGYGQALDAAASAQALINSPQWGNGLTDD